MRYAPQRTLSLVACLVVVGWLAVHAQDTSSGGKVLVAKSFRASKLVGLHVRNMDGEKLGKVEDLVVNVENGKISYIAMSFGGILGLGDKLFAIPYDQVKFDHGQDEMFFVVNMTKEKLQAAPGFDKNNWPNFADPNWSQKIDNYYRRAQAEWVNVDSLENRCDLS